ncbi:MerR family transcriptional regulator [Flaviaesturariibacter flavus]|nr:MerR family transcriptional regulator [Flaviaesturariibacter flavus]
MDKDQFQFAFDFFGEPEKPAEQPPGSDAPAPEQLADAPLPIADSEETPEVHFPEPIELPTLDIPSEFLSGAPVAGEAPRARSKRGRKSQKAMAEEVANVQVPPDEELNKKQYYGITEVAAMFGVNASLLRYWESAFGMQLRKNRKGDRFFTPQDIRTVQLIHDLLRRRKFTIDGARDFLRKNKGADQRYELIQSLQRVRKFLVELKAQL